MFVNVEPEALIEYTESICVVVNYLWFREVYRFYFITNPTN